MEYCPHCLFIDHCFMNKKKLMLCTLEKCAEHIISLDHTRGYPPILLSRVKRINKGYNSLGLQIAHQKDYSSNTSTL